MQTALNFDAPPLAQARAVGEIGMQRAERAAERDEPGFRDRAGALILAKLAHGPASGEDCTDYVRAAGMQMKDGRALGATYAQLIDRGLIRKVGDCKRRRGNGTSGGSVYMLTTPGPVTRNEQGRFTPVAA
jgi:hypothetical protein